MGGSTVRAPRVARLKVTRSRQHRSGAGGFREGGSTEGGSNVSEPGWMDLGWPDLGWVDPWRMKPRCLDSGGLRGVEIQSDNVQKVKSKLGGSRVGLAF